jgi:hypothetical protein
MHGASLWSQDVSVSLDAAMGLVCDTNTGRDGTRSLGDVTCPGEVACRKDGGSQGNGDVQGARGDVGGGGGVDGGSGE